MIGGGSRIGTALVPLLGDAATYLSRRLTGHQKEIRTEDYGCPPKTAWNGVTSVINCVGISKGSARDLKRVNVDIPCRLAATAKSKGVRHFLQISSFSVYGNADRIDAETVTLPVGEYGRSKLNADMRLLELADDRFSVTILRLPLIYSRKSLGRLGQLLRLWTRLRVIPVPAGDVARAMIGVDLSAEVIARLAIEPRNGIVFAADPRHFTYADTARTRRETLHRLPLPRSIVKLATRVMPAICGRLFADSRLAEKDNQAIRYRLESTLYHDIASANI